MSRSRPRVDSRCSFHTDSAESYGNKVLMPSGYGPFFGEPLFQAAAQVGEDGPVVACLSGRAMAGEHG